MTFNITVCVYSKMAIDCIREVFMSDRAFFKRMIERTRQNERDIKHLVVTSQRSEIAGGVPRVALADLPTAGKKGRLFFCTDCTNSLSGRTGTVVYDDGSDWREIYGDAIAS